MMLTRNDLVAVMPRAASVADQVTPALDAAMARYEIDTPARMAAFLAQLAHESGQLQRWNENLGYRWQRLRQVFPKYFKTDAEAQAFDRQDERIANRVYGGRLGNGPEDSGDGWRYRGRGPIQLTGKDNYRTCGAAIGVDLVSQPERLETPEVGCLAAGWFWSKRGLNALADAGDFVAITKKINGGLIGLEDREAFWSAPRPRSESPRRRWRPRGPDARRWRGKLEPRPARQREGRASPPSGYRRSERLHPVPSAEAVRRAPRRRRSSRRRWSPRSARPARRSAPRRLRLGHARVGVDADTEERSSCR